MRFLVLLLVLLTATNIARAADTPFKVGVTTRDLIPAEPFDWRSAKTHILRVTIWYPAIADAREVPQWIGPPLFPLISAGRAARDAVLADGRYPLILLSHGFGGTASDLAWLGTALAAHGLLAVAVNHPGNNGLEDVTVAGFALMWLRAVDLSAVIDALLGDRALADHIDPARIGAAGHSLGGYTVLAAAGGITDPARTREFCRSDRADSLCTSQPEVAGLRQRSADMLRSDPDYRQRFDKAGYSYRDERIRAVFAMAPGPVPAFVPESLGAISIPVAIVTGTADIITPPASGAEAIGNAIPNATLKRFQDAGHFVFYDDCTAMGQIFIPMVCRDPADVDREAIHAQTIKLALDFFAANLRSTAPLEMPGHRP